MGVGEAWKNLELNYWGGEVQNLMVSSENKNVKPCDPLNDQLPKNISRCLEDRLEAPVITNT